MTVYAYLFLSTASDDLVSLAEQRRIIGSWSAEKGMTPLELVVEEGISRHTRFADRPQGGRLLQMLQPGDAILTARSSWVLVSPVAACHLLDTLRSRRVSLYCADLGEDISLPGERRLIVSEGCAGLVRKVLASLASCAGDDHAERIRAGKRRRRLQGKYEGGPIPFGWQLDESGYLKKDAAQQKLLGIIRVMRKNGCSFRQIADNLTKAHAIRLSHEGIRRILLREEEVGNRMVPDDADSRS